MANFNTNTTQSGFNAETYTQQMVRARQGQRDDVSNKFGFSSYDVVGINTTKIPAMRAAIRDYVEKVYDHLHQIQTTTDPSVALKGTGMEDAVKDYVKNVVEYCTSLCSNLLAFSDKLVKVEEAWKNSDMNMSSKVNTGTSGLSSAAGQRYEEQFKSGAATAPGSAKIDSQPLRDFGNRGNENYTM